MLTAYSDDSHGEGIYVVAGYVASLRQWRQFDREWYRVLKHHGLKSFHTVEAYSAHGEYWGKSAEAIINDLIPVIVNNVCFGVSSLINHRAFLALMPLQVRELEPFNDPYMQGFDDVIFMSLKYMETHNLRDRIKFVFDHKDPIGPKVRNEFMSGRKAISSPRRDRIVGEPTFEQSEGLPGLQAADLLAWHLRRKYARNIPIADDSVLSRLSLVPMLHRPWTAEHIRKDHEERGRVYRDLDQTPTSELTMEKVDAVRDRAIERVKRAAAEREAFNGKH